MAKTWLLWDENDDGDKPKKKKTKNQKPPIGFWSDTPEGAVDDGFDDFFRVDDGTGDTAADPYLSGSAYDYSGAFDDSANYWHRKNSFQYKSRVDYSPSRLFRSTFTTRYATYSDHSNEAKNKAVRALRTLTRNANTVTSTTNKGTYTVQFSSGKERNAVTSALNNEQQRVIFVSPDDLLNTKTAEDEDNVVDALTGFVLLRVQLAQSLPLQVSKEINATDMGGIGLYIGQELFALPHGLDNATPEELQRISDTAVDKYLAGVLAKSLLTRLARRETVKNWGGFAPYFARHAKKFSATREVLAAAELTLETLVGRIAYNLIDDENHIELPPFAADALNKWLAEEIPPEDILAVCFELVIYLRSQFAPAGLPLKGPDDVGTLLDTLLQQLQAEKTRAAVTEETRNFLTDFGNTLFDAHHHVQQSKEAITDAHRDVTAAHNVAANRATVEQLANILKTAAAECEKLASTKPEEPAPTTQRCLLGGVGSLGLGRYVFNAEHGQHQLAAVINKLRYNINARPGARTIAIQSLPLANRDEALRTFDAYQDSLDLLSRTAEWDPNGLTREHAAELHAQTERVAALVASAVENATVEKLLTDALAAAKKIIADVRERTAVTAAHMQQMGTQFASTGVPENVDPNLHQNVSTALQQTEEHAKVDSYLSEQIARVADLEKRNARARSLKGREKALQELKDLLAQLARHTAYMLTNALPANHTHDGLVHRLNSVMEGVRLDVTEKANTVANAVAYALTPQTVSSKELVSAAVAELLMENVPNADEVSSVSALLDHLSELMQKYPMYEAVLTELTENLGPGGDSIETASTAGKNFQAASSRQVKKHMSVDGELFGEKVAVNTVLLDANALCATNEEARNAQEEEFVVYLDGIAGNNAKPKIVTKRENDPRCKGREDETARKNIKDVRQKYKKFIERIQNALQFQAGKRTTEEYGLRSGDLDEGGLHKLQYDCEHIWTKKKIAKLPDVAIGILVDQSGSMNGDKICRARTLCIILAQALRNITGVRLYVYGHTANLHGSCSELTLYEHYTPTMGDDFTALGLISAHSNNYDGYAIKEAARKLNHDPAKKKYLFVLSDGMPHGRGYAGKDAEKHVNSVCKFIRDKLKIGLYTFGVGIYSCDQADFVKQYGEKYSMIVDDIMKCLPQIVRFLHNTLQQEKQLITDIAD